jgi:hypothetical protein
MKAIRITEYRTVTNNRVKSVTIHGLVSRTGTGFLDISSGVVFYHFEITTTTAVLQHGVPVQLSRAKPGQSVSVHYRTIRNRLVAYRIILLVTPARRPRFVSVSGVCMDTTPSGFVLEAVTGETSMVLYSAKMARHELVSVRGYHVGASFKAIRVRHLLTLSIPSTTIRGILIGLAAETVTVKDGKHDYEATMIRTTRISQGGSSALKSRLKTGESVSLRFWSVGRANYAASLHIYVRPFRTKPIPTRPKVHRSSGSIVGVVTHLGGGHVTISASGAGKQLILATFTPVRLGSRISDVHQLRRGQQVSAHFYCLSRTCTATSIHIYVHSSRTNPLGPTKMTGIIRSIGNGNVVLDQATGSRRIQLTPGTKIYVRSARIPRQWLFVGPVAAISLQYRGQLLPSATTIDFRPRAATISGDVVSVFGTGVVADSNTSRQQFDFRAARISIDGRRRSIRDVNIGSHVKVSGFVLPSGVEAATAVVVSHPLVKVAGTVQRVASWYIVVARASGATITVTFAPGVRAWSSSTGQWFPRAAIPVLSHLSGTGINVQGRIRLTSAAVSLRKESINGNVVSTSKEYLSVQSVSGTVRIWIGGSTKIAVGAVPLELRAIENGDVVSCTGFADTRGGLLGVSVVVHRTVLTRTGTVVLLRDSGFDLVLKDGSLLHVDVGPTTVISQLGNAISLQDLRNNDQVTVRGSLRPASFTIDATLIEVI